MGNIKIILFSQTQLMNFKGHKNISMCKILQLIMYCTAVKKLCDLDIPWMPKEAKVSMAIQSKHMKGLNSKP